MERCGRLKGRRNSEGQQWWKSGDCYGQVTSHLGIASAGSDGGIGRLRAHPYRGRQAVVAVLMTETVSAPALVM
jgi:hypothetical protein